MKYCIKKIVIAAALCAGLSGIVALNSMQNISIPKIVEEIRQFAVQVPSGSVENVTVAVTEMLDSLPIEVLGINVASLKDGSIDAGTAASVSGFLMQVKGMVDRVNGLIKMPDTALQLVQTVSGIALPQLPLSAQNTVRAALLLADKVIKSTDENDKNLIKSVQLIVATLQQVVARLVVAQERNELVGYQIVNDINQFKSLVAQELPVIQEAIERHSEIIEDVIVKGSSISMSDLDQVMRSAQNLLSSLRF